MRPTVFAAIALLAVTLPASAEPPKGWFLAGSHPKDYSVDVDGTSAHSGRTSALLASRTDGAQGFGTLMQTATAEPYRGKRLRFTAYARSKGIEDWAGLWLRVDGRESSLSFDNMQDRPIKGDSDWRAYSIVLDVPEQSTNIAYGVLLSGAGSVWMDAASFEVVDPTVPTTGMGRGSKPPAAPSNLDFEP